MNDSMKKEYTDCKSQENNQLKNLIIEKQFNDWPDWKEELYKNHYSSGIYSYSSK